jgi:hypothetical protein
MACSASFDTLQYADVPNSALVEESFTLSFNIEKNVWVSFHDYVPDASILLRNNTLLHFYKKGMYRHNIGRKGVYFGAAFESYMCAVLAPRLKNEERAMYPFVINSINWNTDIENGEIRMLEKTWNTISIHNSFQGTQQKILVPFKENCDFLSQFGVANTRRIKNRWVYNYAFNEKVKPTERTWKEVCDDFFIINTAFEGCSEEALTATTMFDDYVIVKLGFDNSENLQLHFYELNFDINIVTDGTYDR